MPRPSQNVLPSADQSLRQLEESLTRSAESLQAQLDTVHEALSNLDKIRRGEFAPSKRPTSGPFRYASMDIIDAVRLYLEKTGRPWTQEELIEEVISGGAYSGKNVATPGQVKKSLKYFLYSRKEKQRLYGKRIKNADPKLRQIGRLIGLAEWPDERFKI